MLIISKFLNWLAKNRVLRSRGVAISKYSKVNFRGIGGKGFSSLVIGSGSIVEGWVVADKEGARVTIGKNTFFGLSKIVCAESVEIGDDVLISWGCHFVDHDSHAITWADRCDDVKNWYVGIKDWGKVTRKGIIVERRAWIGFNSTVLKGVVIGEGAVVGSGSVVTKDVPPYTIVAGNPARVIREILPNG